MRRTVQLSIAIALLAACSSEPISTENASSSAARALASQTAASEASVRKDLATLRQVTVKFHEFETAKHAGWNAKITSCMTDPVLGGMGFHYGNPKFIDRVALV